MNLVNKSTKQKHNILKRLIHRTSCGLRHEDPTRKSLLHYNPKVQYAKRFLKVTNLLLWRKRHVFRSLQAVKVSWKSPFRCKISPFFAKKSRFELFFVVESIKYAFSAPNCLFYVLSPPQLFFNCVFSAQKI